MIIIITMMVSHMVKVRIWLGLSEASHGPIIMSVIMKMMKTKNKMTRTNRMEARIKNPEVNRIRERRIEKRMNCFRILTSCFELRIYKMNSKKR